MNTTAHQDRPGIASDDLPGFWRTHLTYDGAQREIYYRGEGPAVLIVHEMPGLTPEVAAFGERVANAGYFVAMPSIFGTPGKAMGNAYLAGELLKGCVRKEFAAFSRRRSSPVTRWLRAFARDLHAHHGGPGVGFVGMCFTGNYGLAMMAEPAVLAPVLSQPSMPLALTPSHARSLQLSPEELAICQRRAKDEGCGPLALRFTGDALVPAARFETLRKVFGGHAETIEIDSRRGNAHGIARTAHSVLTLDLVDEQGHPTRAALDRVLALFAQRLKPEAIAEP
ncbi:MAG: dienelactone hydrolase family protein [Myxococcales bacterium]|nr:dienelactone hydrolase family protein [Myxococcales bacterium]